MAAGNDRDFLHRVVVRHQRTHQGMARFVVGHEALALLAHHPILLLWTGHHPLNRVVHLIHGDFGELATGGQDRRLVEQVGQIGSGEPRGAARDLVEVHILGEGLATGMHLEDLQPTAVVGAVNHHLAVKAARTHQGRIQHIGTVGGRHDDDAGVALKAIHLGEQLVEGLLPLVVATTQAGAALAAHGVDLVDEDNAGGTLLGVLEEVTHPAGTHPHKHLHELRTGDGEEGNTRLAGHRLGQQGFAGARGADQQHTLRNFGANGGEAIGILEEVDHLGELELGALNTSHITKGDLGLGLHLQARLALAKAHGRVAATALGAAQQKEQTPQQQQGEEQAAHRLLPGRRFTAGLHRDVHVVVGEQLQQILVGSEIHHGPLAAALHHLGGAAVGGDQHPRHLIGLNRLHKVAVAQGARRVGRVGTIEERRAHGDHHDHQEHVQPRVAPAFVQSPRLILSKK